MTTRCRACRTPVRAGAPLCPGCGAPQAAHAHGGHPGPAHRAAFFVLLAVGALGTLAAGWWASRPLFARLWPDPVRIAIERLPAVYTMTAYSDSGEAFGQGTGFLVGAGGLAISNYHVLGGAARAEAAAADGRIYDVTSVEAFDPARDVCVFRIGRIWHGEPEPPPATVRPLELRREPPVRTGERVVVLGSPKGFANSVSDGLVSALRTEDGRDYLQFTAPVSGGSSGGPLFDARGKVVGMATGSGANAQNLNFAIPAPALAPYVAERRGWPMSRVLATMRDSARACVEHADSLWAHQHYGDALELYSRANDDDPRWPAAMLGMSLCYRMLGNPERAAQWYEAYVELTPDEAVRRRQVRRYRVPTKPAAGH